LHGDSRRQRIAKREARSTHIEYHAVAGVDDVDAGAFTNAQGTQAARFVRGAANVDYSCLATRLAG